MGDTAEFIIRGMAIFAIFFFFVGFYCGNKRYGDLAGGLCLGFMYWMFAIGVSLIFVATFSVLFFDL